VTPSAAGPPLDIPCPLCSSSPRDTLSTRDRRGRPLHTVICRSCGLVSHADIPSEESLRDFYAERYRAEYHREETPSPKRVLRAWRQGLRLLRLLGPRLAPGARVHEFGAGIGCTVKVFERAGFDATGIEPGRGFQRFAEERLRARVRNATLDEAPGESRADLGLLVHVIEHLRDPVASLRQIRDRLTPDGLLYVECPNLEAPFARFDRLFHSAHIFNFTAATLDAVARVAGFTLVEPLSEPPDENLARLYRPAEPQPVRAVIDPRAHERTTRAVRRLNIVTYHARPRYLTTRTRKIGERVSEAAIARAWLRRLEMTISAGAARVCGHERPCACETGDGPSS